MGIASRGTRWCAQNPLGAARAELGKFFDPELIEHLFDGLRKAGLEIAEAN